MSPRLIKRKQFNNGQVPPLSLWRLVLPSIIGSGPSHPMVLGDFRTPPRCLTFTSRNCQSDDAVPGTRVCFLFFRAATDRYQPRTKRGMIKPLTTVCFRPYVSAHVSNYVNCHFTVYLTWPPRHPSKSAQSRIAMSSHRTRA